ncbi:hypothetical protein [uncultured Cohaesibacter sp.]|uniref:hypothetical protein n=1 Tax=uncultured Cohaesibacter sp. TaxID=1002546 RepID=UPI0029C6E0EC|nr:hypothetical protein [uncultured Cohaesibacter sp.]
MPTKPFHRIYRKVKSGHPNAGSSSISYIQDPDYAQSPTHYVRAYNLIQNDLQKLFEYIEPSMQSREAYSFRIHELLMRTCIEIEANFKAILSENTFTPEVGRFGPIFNMSVYKKVNHSHHLSDYEILLPEWNGDRRIWKPFEAWGNGESIEWYQSYNASKHDRKEAFSEANLEVLINAVAGLLVLLSSQFETQDFSAGSVLLSVGGYDYHELEPAIGSMFRIKFPDTWAEDELYDFDWRDLKDQENRFQKFNYDEV